MGDFKKSVLPNEYVRSVAGLTKDILTTTFFAHYLIIFVIHWVAQLAPPLSVFFVEHTMEHKNKLNLLNVIKSTTLR